MKKTAFAIALAIVLLTLSSCGGLKNRNSVHATDFISGENISIKINVKKADISGHHSDFAISKDINGLAEMIAKKNPSLSTAIYQDRFILITTSATFFLIEQIEKYDQDKENENRYMFFAPAGSLGMYANVHIPYHLIKDLIDISYWPYKEDVDPDKTEYEVSGTIEDFYNFYNKLQQYDVEKGTDFLIVTIMKNSFKMMLTFSQNESSSKVTVSGL